MKRLFTAVSFAVLALPAVAAQIGAPYDQSEVDRALPQIPEKAAAVATRSRAERGLPFDQAELDRAQPAL